MTAEAAASFLSEDEVSSLCQRVPPRADLLAEEAEGDTTERDATEGDVVPGWYRRWMEQLCPDLKDGGSSSSDFEIDDEDPMAAIVSFLAKRDPVDAPEVPTGSPVTLEQEDRERHTAEQEDRDKAQVNEIVHRVIGERASARAGKPELPSLAGVEAALHIDVWKDLEKAFANNADADRKDLIRERAGHWLEWARTDAERPVTILTLD
jgi:hypothetical protein